MKWFLHCKLTFSFGEWNVPKITLVEMESLSQQHSRKKKKCYGNHFSRGNSMIGTSRKSQWLTKTKIYFLTYVGCWGFPHGSVVENPPANAGDTGDAGSIPGLGRSPGVGNGNPLQYSCLGNPMDREPGGLQSMWLQNQTRISAHALCCAVLLPSLISTRCWWW